MDLEVASSAPLIGSEPRRDGYIENKPPLFNHLSVIDSNGLTSMGENVLSSWQLRAELSRERDEPVLSRTVPGVECIEILMMPISYEC